MFVAQNVTLANGQTLTSSAAPLLAASLRRNRHPVRIARLRVAEEETPGTLRAYVVGIAGDEGQNLVLAAACEESQRKAVGGELDT
ncbi:hypothetical protein ABZ473_33325 [Streptomyces cellulosae]